MPAIATSPMAPVGFHTRYGDAAVTSFASCWRESVICRSPKLTAGNKRTFCHSYMHRRRRAWVQIAVATLSGNSLRQTVHTHRVSVHQAAKLIAALLRVAGVTAGLAESKGS